MDTRWIVKSFIAWRILIFAVALAAIFYIPLRQGYTEVSNPFKVRDLANMWVNFDGLHYLDIARNGYAPTHPAAQAFFPIYPFVTSKVAYLVKDYVFSGLLVSHITFLIALVYLYKLIKLDHKTSVAQDTIITLLLFPTSFFFTCIYSESIFFLEVILAFYWARCGKWAPASIAAGFATATRITGIFLVPALVIEFLASHNYNIHKTISDKKILWLILSPLGLLFYMRFLFVSTGDPLDFVHVMPAYGLQRQLNHIVLLYQVFYRYIKMLIFVDHTDPLFFVVLLEFITGLLFTVLCLLSFKLQRLSYAVFMSASFLLPTLLGTFSSVPRYILVLFPAFILLGQWFNTQNRLAKVFFIIVNTIFSAIAISLFTRGYFIG